MLFDPRLPDRFWRKVIPEPNSGCWLWLGAANSAGYGQTWDGKRVVYAHRHAYSTLIAKIPDGFDLDHLCRTPLCCNPAHLEAVSHYENCKRGIRGAWLRTNLCPRGHSMTDAYIRGDGSGRQCAECARMRGRKQNEVHSP